MVRLNRIYTKTGDDGTTGLGDGSRQFKDSALLEAIGDVDEANCAVGIARTWLSVSNEANEASDSSRSIDQSEAETCLDAVLARVQNDLFDVGADLCCPSASAERTNMVLRIQETHVQLIEDDIDRFNARLEPLRSFVLPGGSHVAAALHLSRAITRRAERSVIRACRSSDKTQGVIPVVAVYLNRLSDLLFVTARNANNFGASDVLWQPGKSLENAR